MASAPIAAYTKLRIGITPSQPALPPAPSSKHGRSLASGASRVRRQAPHLRPDVDPALLLQLDQVADPSRDFDRLADQRDPPALALRHAVQGVAAGDARHVC